MIRAVIFDMGGTLDGDGLHWLDRFVELYASANVSLPRDVIRAAFDAAERRAATNETIMTARLDQMIRLHVDWQIEYLRASGVHASLETGLAEQFRDHVVNGFVRSVRSAAASNGSLLEALWSRGLQLGVVSNGCGNVDALCDDLGYTPFLSLVVDSRRVGVSKPDPAIYACAIERLGLPAASIMMVGDSFERDIRPARSIGMQTAWLEGPAGPYCPDRSCVDVSLHSLADLADALDARSRTVA